jgi:hypothetical protein
VQAITRSLEVLHSKRLFKIDQGERSQRQREYD